MFIIYLLFLYFNIILCNGESAVIVYSRDNNCKGQEMIRAYSNECKSYYSNDDSLIDYFQFECNKEKNILILKQYNDKYCKKYTGNSTILIKPSSTTGSITTTTIGSCQQFGSENSNYHSAQLFCGGISSINNPKTFFSAFETEKIMFKHYTNADNTCSNKPSVIELVTFYFIYYLFLFIIYFIYVCSLLNVLVFIFLQWILLYILVFIQCLQKKFQKVLEMKSELILFFIDDLLFVDLLILFKM